MRCGSFRFGHLNLFRISIFEFRIYRLLKIEKKVGIFHHALLKHKTFETEY
jgi:hypothetical protein